MNKINSLISDLAYKKILITILSNLSKDKRMQLVNLLQRNTFTHSTLIIFLQKNLPHYESLLNNNLTMVIKQINNNLW